MKCYDFEIQTEKTNRNVKVAVNRKASLTLDDNTCIGDIIQFEQDAKKVLNAVKKAYKDDMFMNVSLSVMVYDEGCDGLVSKSYDHWQFIGYQDGDEGLHMNPDTRYTDEYHDIWIGYKEGFFEGIKNL
jgi:hypothetical protein